MILYDQYIKSLCNKWLFINCKFLIFFLSKQSYKFHSTSPKPNIAHLKHQQESYLDPDFIDLKSWKIPSNLMKYHNHGEVTKHDQQKFIGKSLAYVLPYCKWRGFFYLQEFPFFTLTSFPPGFLVHVGGVVSARSVKLLDRIHNPGEFKPHKYMMS